MHSGGVALLAVALAACSANGKPEADSGPDAGATTTACPTAAQKPNGGCCGLGSAYDLTTASCVGVGPLACAGLAVDKMAECAPKTCWDLRDSQGAACPKAGALCMLDGRTCTMEELAAGKGCAAGYWPGGPAASCIPAGLRGKVATADAAGQPVPATVADLLDDEDPAATAARFCSDGPTAPIRLCRANETGCGPHAMPGVDAGNCQPVGVAVLCPPGFVVDATAAVKAGQSAPCVPDPAACGTDPFGGQPTGPDVRFVDASASANGNGSKTQPFATLADALAATPAGGTIAIAKGQYTGPLVLTKPVTLRGRCAAMVSVVGCGGAPAVVNLPQAAAAGDYQLSGIQISGACSGLMTIGPTAGRPLLVQDVWFDKVVGAGVLVGLNQDVTLRHSVVSRVEADAKNAVGVGSAVADGKLTADGVRWHRNLAYGLWVDGAQAQATLRDVRIDDTQATATASSIGLLVGEGATLVAAGMALSGRHGVAVRVTDAKTYAQLSGAVVTSTFAAGSISATAAFLVDAAASAEFAGIVAVGRMANAMVVADKATAAVHGAIFDPEVPDPAKAPALGVAVDAGTVTLHQFAIHGGSTGIAVAGGGQLELAHGRIVGCQRQADGGHGVGLAVGDGSTASLDTVAIAQAELRGILAGDVGTSLWATNVLIANIGAGDSPKFGTGLTITSGAQVTLQGARVHHAGTSAVLAVDANSTLRATGVLVDATPGHEGLVGAGIGIVFGATGHLAGCRTWANHGIGLACTTGGAPTLAELRGHLGDFSQPMATNSGGIGLSVRGPAATVLVNDSVLVGNVSAASTCDHATLTMDGSVIKDTLAGKFVGTSIADGLVIYGGKLTLARSVVTGNARAGIVLREGASADLGASAIFGGFFGIVLQQKPELHTAGLALFDNNQSQVGDDALPVPPPPALAEVQTKP